MNLKQARELAHDLPSAEIMWLLEKATNKSATILHLSEELQLTKEESTLFLDMVEQRKNNIPLQYLLGSWDFMGMPFKCKPNVLIPRRDTEVLANEAANFLKKGSVTSSLLLDLCTGSGCVGIYLAKYCLHTTLADISTDALNLAEENATLNNVKQKVSIVQSDLFENISGHFNCITVNPPYIPTDEIDSLPNDVKKEPRCALDGGHDGLDFYRKIIPAATRFLLPSGTIFLEVGFNQSKAVTALLRKNGFKAVVTTKDLEARDRVVQGTRSLPCLTD